MREDLDADSTPEPRLLRAVDFTVTAPAMQPTFGFAGTTASGAFTVPIVIRNVGTTSFSGQIDIDIVLSRDTIIGNADDVVDNAAFLNRVVAPGETVDTGNWLFEFDTVPGPGGYFGKSCDGGKQSLAKWHRGDDH